ncbi:hypothetical protein Micbo1qcDRAFT_204421 [Microdochium bolleyi]|uniref:Uncharacterized protein n=1 Tax=Microdochium bolleyi TaxID=196109 RepID=A0A136J5F9_9PEZI|nr:hypothetical protein Micbo1qcDRAFT_204421 [Microdochium bolleyi]
MVDFKIAAFSAAALLLKSSYAAPPPPVTAVPGSPPPSTIVPGCPAPTVPPQWDIGLPESCFDPLAIKTPCFTWTTTAPAVTCPHIHCAPPAPTQVCPLYLKVSSTTVPCSTDCCPFTPTATYSCGACPSCDPCRVPTELTVFTTGCAGGGVQSTVTTITPPPYW